MRPRRRNPDLPILDELEGRYEALVQDELRDGAGSPGGGGRRRARRVARRVGTMLLLLCTVGGVALAARLGGGEEKPPANTQPALLGTDRGEDWKLFGYRHQGRLCVMLAIAGDLAGDCGETSSSRGVRAASLIGSGERLVFGIVPPEVVRVAIRIGEWRGGAPTRRLESPDAAESAGVPPQIRWFAVAIPLPRLDQETSRPARIVGFEEMGRALGAGTLDCSLGASERTCRRIVRARAREALR